MACRIKNNSNYDLSKLTQLTNEFYPYAKKTIGFDKGVTIIFKSDLKNAQNPLGKTAFYDPSNFSVTVYVDNRHPKDVMRSVSHVLVHHHQNCQGKFKNIGPTEEGYAQSDPYLRELEKDAYKRGNLVFRDWENQKNIKRENKSMKDFKSIVKEVLAERNRKNSPDRMNKPVAQDRLKPLEEEEIEEVEEKPELEEATAEEADLEESEKAEEVVESEEPEEVKEEVEEEKPLKEWYNTSIYNKLLKEYTKR